MPTIRIMHEQILLFITQYYQSTLICETFIIILLLLSSERERDNVMSCNLIRFFLSYRDAVMLAIINTYILPEYRCAHNRSELESRIASRDIAKLARIINNMFNIINSYTTCVYVYTLLVSQAVEGSSVIINSLSRDMSSVYRVAGNESAAHRRTPLPELLHSAQCLYGSVTFETMTKSPFLLPRKIPRSRIDTTHTQRVLAWLAGRPSAPVLNNMISWYRDVERQGG